MLPEWINSFTPYFIAVAGVVSGIIVAWINKRGTREKDLIDQLQEERDKAVAEKDKAVGNLETKLDKFKQEVKEQNAANSVDIDKLKRDAELRDAREKLYNMYIYALHNHINLQLPPPPPAWPEGLIPQ